MTRSRLASLLVVSAWLLIACRAETPGPRELIAQDAAITAPVASEWHSVFDALDSLVLAGWAASDDDVFFVGSEGQVLRYQHAQWSRYEVPTQATLWWIWGTSASNVYAGGEGGTLLHFDGSIWSNVAVGLDKTQTIWGIWGASAADIWLVGGNARSNGPGFVLRGDGTQFTRQDFGEALPNLFKVWGKSENDVYLVGDRGIVMHFERGDLTTEYLDPRGNGARMEMLFTVAGNASGELIAVGGVTAGLLFEKQGSTWEFDDLQTPGLNGVVVAKEGEAYAVGQSGTIRHRVDGNWLNEDYAPGRHYHGVVLMGAVAFAVGGDLLSSKADRKGLIACNGDVTGGEITWIPKMSASAVDSGSPDASVAVPVENPTMTDAGHEPTPDAGHMEGGAPDSGHHQDSGPSEPLPGPSALCTINLECNAATECWLIQGEHENHCVTPCTTATECPPEYGPNPQCAAPGCQTLYTVCMPAAWKGCF